MGNAARTCIEGFVLHPKVVSRALELAIEVLRPSSGHTDRERARLDKNLQNVRTEIGHLTRALAAGGDLPSLLAALQQAEHQRKGLENGLGGARASPSGDRARWQ